MKTSFKLNMVLLVAISSLAVLALENRVTAEDAPAGDDEPAWPEYVVREAALPAGWPAPGPVGEVVEKSFPASRTYWAGGNMNLAFMRCFRHLQEHDLEMTAPVVMDYQHHERDLSALEERIAGPVALERLHFVLEEPSLDELGVEGPVEVEDTPALQVLSVGYQGDLTDEAIRECEAQLAAALGEREDLQSAGPARILGYNSPMVPEQRRYWEVQLPVEAAE